jgi:dihydroneopterin aldolase
MLWLGVLSLRYASRSLALSRTLRYQQYQSTHRRDARTTFSTTPKRLASEVPDDFIDAIKHTELFKKIANKPEALKALSDLYKLANEMGVVFPFLSIAAARC